jgi:glycosyltransferase involved in cell wall biosynthesis
MCTVSVIIPTYKHRDFVVQTLESVLSQSFSDYEVIVVNDGSPDDTERVLRPPIESEKIRYFRQPNRGQAAARNRGLAEAHGELIAFLDDDDLWLPDKLQWQVDLLGQFPQAVLAYGDCEVFGRRGPGEPSGDGPDEEIFCGDHTDRLLELNHIVSPGCTLIRADVLRTIGGFDELLWGADDWDLYLSLSRQGPFAYRKRTALLYRRHDDNASRDSFRMYLNCCIVQRRHDRLQPPGKRPPARPLNRRMRTHYCHECIRRAQVAIRARDLRSGLGWWTRAARIDPTFTLNHADPPAALVEAIFPEYAANWVNRAIRAVRWRLRPVLDSVTKAMD